MRRGCSGTTSHSCYSELIPYLVRAVLGTDAYKQLAEILIHAGPTIHVGDSGYSTYLLVA